MHHRKKPFSGKRKKQQLQEKRARQNEQVGTGKDVVKKKVPLNSGQNPVKGPQQNKQPQKKVNKLTTVFEKESQEEIEKRKLDATRALRRGIEGQDTYYGELIDIPLRPYWETSMTKEEVESNEERLFKGYLENVYKKFPKERLNHFEHNLEVWRQLWRVCEISDILFILADSRHPLFHFPPSLYRYVVKTLSKPMALVLTKTDLVPEKVVNLWLNYFRKTFPGLMVTTVRSFEVDKTEEISLEKKRRRRKRFAKQIPTGTRELIKFINGLVVERGYQPLELPQNDDDEDNDQSSEEEESSSEEDEVQKEPPAEDLNQDILFQDPNKSFITLGFIGHPNVGKSTLINTLKGKKVCSTSRTPGHTKYKQTVFLNDTVMLCDCPGLVFPASDVPKILQVVCGIYPIAQVREPYSAIRYIAERVPLETVYKLEKLEDDDEKEWSPYSLCEAYAEKRGYHTRKGRPDTHRAALEILRDHLDGRVVLYFTPNSTKINVAVYEEEASPTDFKIDEVNEEEINENNKKPKSKETKYTSDEESSEEDEEDESSDDQGASTNPFALLSEV